MQWRMTHISTLSISSTSLFSTVTTAESPTGFPRLGIVVWRFCNRWNALPDAQSKAPKDAAWQMSHTSMSDWKRVEET